MPRKRQPRSSLTPFFILLLVVSLAACTYLVLKQPPASPLQSTPDLISDDRILFGGAPRPAPTAGTEVSFEILKNRAYIVGYSESRKDPLWSAYRVFHTDHPFDSPRPSTFTSDPRTSAHIKTSDFANSGYDRGHMTPNSAIAHDFGTDAQLETFLLSNICPQSKLLNERVWEKLETAEKKYADIDEEVWVIDGPIFADLNGGTTSTLPAGIAIPSAFYKIVIDEQDRPGGAPRLFSVIMPQSVTGTEVPEQYLTTVSEIEKETHLQFLWKLPPGIQTTLKSTRFPMWP